MTHPSSGSAWRVFPGPETGAYVLVLYLPALFHLTIGHLGRYRFDPGHYVYAGSAFGPGGLSGRLRHHLAPIARPHWHVDYLRIHTQLREIWYAAHAIRRECDWASILASMPGMSAPIRRFGASDCRCRTHLFYTEAYPSRTVFAERVLATFPNDAPVQHVDVFGGVKQ